MRFGSAFGFERRRRSGVTGGGATVPGAGQVTAAPTLTGNAIIGQPLFATAGSYNIPPDSIDRAWLLDDLTATGDIGDNHLCDNIEQGRQIKYVETAHFGATTLTNSSALSAAIAARTVGAVSLTRTSALAASPLTYSITLPADCYPGDVLVAETSPDTTFNDSLQKVAHALTAAEIADPTLLPAAFTAEGFADPGSTNIMRVTLAARLPDDTTLSTTSALIGKNYTPVAATDNFDDGVVNPGLWGADANWMPGSTTGGTVAEVNGRLEITVQDGVAARIGRPTLNAAPFRGKFVQLERCLVTNSGVVEAGLRIGPDISNGYILNITAGSVYLQGLSAGAYTGLGSFADPDYGSGNIPPTTYMHFRVWNDYSAGVRDDIVLMTAPPSAARPPVFADFTERLRVARNNIYWNGTDACHHAFHGGQWSGATGSPLIAFDNYNTDAAV